MVEVVAFVFLFALALFLIGPRSLETVFAPFIAMATYIQEMILDRFNEWIEAITGTAEPDMPEQPEPDPCDTCPRVSECEGIDRDTCPRCNA